MTFLSETLGPRLVPDRRVMLPLLIVLAATVVVGLLAAQQAMLALVVVMVALLALAMLIWPDVPSLVVIFILYSNAADVAVQFHGVPFIVGASVPVLLVIPLAHYLIFRRQKLIANPVLPLVLLFHVVQLFGAVFSKDVGLATVTLVRYTVEGLVLYFLITNVVRTPETLRRAIWILLIAGAFVGGLSFYQQTTETYDNNYGGFAQVSDAAFGTGVETLRGEVEQPRLTGPIGEQNRYAQNLLMLVPLGLFRLWGERSKFLRVLAAILTGLTMLGFATAFSRGAAIAFAVMILIMVLMRYIKLRHLAIILAGVTLLLVALPEYGTRVAKLQGLVGLVSDESSTGAGKPDGSLEGRANEMLAAALVFADHPLIGVGPDMFPYHYQDYAALAGFKVSKGEREAHNLYLGIAADNGVLGLICFLAILFVTFRNLARTRQRWMHSRPEFANMATGFIVAIITYLTTGVGLHFGYVRFFWLIMALAGAASYVVDVEARASEQGLKDGDASLVRDSDG